MSVLRQSVAVLGLGIGLSNASYVARSEQQQKSYQTWLSWLIRTPSTRSAESFPESSPTKLIGEKPGRVLVWGGSFGRSPRFVEGVGDRVVRVAVGDGLGAAVDDKGKVRGFEFQNDSALVKEIAIQGRATDVAVRESAGEVVILDSAGCVAVSKQSIKGSFEPAKLLEGPIRRSRICKVRCGKEHCIAVSKRGDAFSWGSSNTHGQLANGEERSSTASDAHIPRKVKLPTGLSVVDAACGNRHTMFLGGGGEVFGVGDDHWAQLGISAEPWLKGHEESSAEVRKSELVMGLAGYAIAGGGQHSVMLVRDGTVFSFGFNQWGQLGHHNYCSLAPPSPIADYSIRAIAISAGDNHTCIVKDNGELWCIGGNYQGQLGTGNLQPSMVWKKVRIGKKVVKPSFIYSMGNTTAAIVPSDTV